MRRYEMSDDDSNKFWQVSQSENTVTVTYGKIGTEGQTKTKVHVSIQAATKEREKLIKEKSGKGYVFVDEILDTPERARVARVEGWMLGEGKIPVQDLLAAWTDTAYAPLLANLIVAPRSATGELDLTTAGFLRDVSSEKGLSLLGLDGETRTISCTTFDVPHPLLLGELAPWKALAAKGGITQGARQLTREIFAKPTDDALLSETSESTYSDTAFTTIGQARQVVRSLGFGISRSGATLSVFDTGLQKSVTITYEITYEELICNAVAEDVEWTIPTDDPYPESLEIREVSAVAYSEGMRMASLIHGKRPDEDDLNSDYNG